MADSQLRRRRPDLEDPGLQERSEHSDISLGDAAHLSEVFIPVNSLPPSLANAPPQLPVERLEIALQKLSVLIQRSQRKSMSDITYMLLNFIGIMVIMLCMILLYVHLMPTLQDARSVMGMVRSKQDALSTTIDNTVILLNSTTVDAVTRYATVVQAASDGMNRVKEILDEPQTQANIQTVTYGISKVDFAKMGSLMKLAIQIAGAITKSAGDNGITLKVGDWQQYLADTDTTLN